MQFSDVKQVKQVIGVNNANTLLNDGWELLAVVPATVNNTASVWYVLGRSTPPPKDLSKLTIEELQEAHGSL